MPSLIDLRRRIRSVQNTEQITKAMKMVSAAKLRRAQQAVTNARPYASLLAEMVDSILQHGEQEEQAFQHPLLLQRRVQTVQVLLLAGEKGLCGSFNSNVFKASREFVGKRAGVRVELELLGRKAVDFYAHREEPVTGTWEQVFNRADSSVASAVASKVMQRFESGEVDQVWMLGNRFRNVLKQETVLQPLLPIMPSEDARRRGAGYDYEQPPEKLLGRLLPQHVVTEVHVAMLESAAAEHAARMTAMDSATRNAGEVLEKLTLHLNRVRQASITTEIIEIVSGAAALE